MAKAPSVNQGMVAYLLRGGKLCPLQKESWEKAQAGIDAAERDYGISDIWIEVDVDEDGNPYCVEEQEWV